MCTLITAAPSYPGLVEECAQQIVPSLLLLFDGLKRAYAAKAAEEEENGDDEDEDESGEEVLSSDEDDIDQDGQDYLERLQVLIIIGFVLFQEILPHTWISGTNF